MLSYKKFLSHLPWLSFWNTFLLFLALIGRGPKGAPKSLQPTSKDLWDLQDFAMKLQGLWIFKSRQKIFIGLQKLICYQYPTPVFTNIIFNSLFFNAAWNLLIGW